MKKPLVVATALVTIALAAPITHAAEPLEFKSVMKELGKNMQVITDGISREDWDLVAKTAPMIAMHPQPPLAERMRIMKFMGPEMSKFKAFDGETHEAAHSLELAAQEKNGQKVITAFRQVQTTCLNCHQAFRSQFVEHFYGAESK